MSSPSNSYSNTRSEIIPFFPSSTSFSNPSVVTSASSILSQLRSITNKKGGQFELLKAEQRVALPAISALIASENSAPNGADLTPSKAQRMSSTNVKLFEQTLKLCREALRSRSGSGSGQSHASPSRSTAATTPSRTTHVRSAPIPIGAPPSNYSPSRPSPRSMVSPSHSTSPSAAVYVSANAATQPSPSCVPSTPPMKPLASSGGITTESLLSFGSKKPKGSPPILGAGRGRVDISGFKRTVPDRIKQDGRDEEKGRVQSIQATILATTGGEAVASVNTSELSVNAAEATSPADIAASIEESAVESLQIKESEQENRPVGSGAPTTPTKSRASSYSAAVTASPSTHARGSPLHQRLLRSRLTTTNGSEPSPGPGSSSIRSPRKRGMQEVDDNPFDDSSSHELLGAPSGSRSTRSHNQSHQPRTGTRSRSRAQDSTPLYPIVEICPISPWVTIPRPPPAFSGPSILHDAIAGERVFKLMAPAPEKTSVFSSIGHEVRREFLEEAAERHAYAGVNVNDDADTLANKDTWASEMMKDKLREADEESRRRRQRKRVRRKQALERVFGTSLDADLEDISMNIRRRSKVIRWDRDFAFDRPVEGCLTWEDRLDDYSPLLSGTGSISTPTATPTLAAPSVSAVQMPEIPAWIRRAETRGIGSFASRV